MEERPSLEEQIRAQLGKNKLGISILNSLLENARFRAACEMANAVAVNRLGYNDHGFTHARIVAANSLYILNILRKHKIEANWEKEGRGGYEEAQAIVMLGAAFHDVGNAVHRQMHEFHGVAIAAPVLDEILADDFSGEKLEKMKLAVSECIYSHDEKVAAVSIEAGVIKVADGTDMEKGRARVPYRMYGKNDVHAVSALAIQNVEIREGDAQKPIRIIIDMSNPAGLFQIEEVLEKKIASSTIADFVSIEPLLRGKPLKDTDLSR